MELIYFVEKKQKVTYEQVKELGLGYAFDSHPACQAVTGGKGPENSSGCTIGRNAKCLGYHPDKQTWQRLAGSDCVWVGMWNERPTAREMVRPNWFNSDYDSEVSDSPLLVTETHGQEWPVPIARAWSLSEGDLSMVNRLPRALEYKVDETTGEKGFFYGQALPMFLRLEEIANVIQEHWTENTLPDNYLELCGEILSMPYYIGPQEMALIGIVDSRQETAIKVLWSTIDHKGFEQLIKKKQAQEQPDTSSGVAA